MMAVASLEKFVSKSKRLVVLTGAGISTESGIPDYRSPGRPKYVPLQHDQFMSSDQNRKRYWFRSMLGFPQLMSSQPNLGHRALAKAEAEGIVHHIITQNVDGLHQMAGSKQVLELHGSIKSVECVNCQALFSRAAVQDWLTQGNSIHSQEALTQQQQLPDGDMGVEGPELEKFLVPGCPKCEGVLKPAIVFFGALLPREVSLRSTELASDCDGLLVVGTSLEVNSASRLLKCAARFPPFDSGLPPAEIMILNDGPTRADQLPGVTKLTGRAGELLSAVFGKT